MTFNDLVGKKLGFYGMDNNFFKLGRAVFEAVEDESDGYRSYMEDISTITDPKKLKSLIFFKKPVDTVKVVRLEGGFEGYELVADDGHVWAKIGTDNADDWYPWCVIEYYPRETK